MKNTNTNTTIHGRIINLTEVETSEALQTASLCETIKIKVHNLTPNNGPITIPVRYTKEDAYILPIGYLEDVMKIWKATKAEFRLLKMMCNLLKS